MITRRVVAAAFLVLSLLALAICRGVSAGGDNARGWTLTIGVADVDRDNDLDVVMSTPLSAVTIAVWLNDGHGHFTPGRAATVAAPFASRTIETAGSTITRDGADDFLGTDAFLVAAGSVAPRPRGRCRALLVRSLARSQLDSPPTNPRGPPLHHIASS